MKKLFGVLLWMVTLLTSCQSSFQEVYLSNIPIQISPPNTQNIEMDRVIKNVTPHIQKILPNAKLGGIVFSGRCEDLPNIQGKIVLDFVGTQFSLPQKRDISIIVSIDTTQQTMDIQGRDETDFYLSMETLNLRDNALLSFEEIANIAFEKIKKLGLPDCNVTLTRFENSWRVRCKPSENFIQKCHFEINAKTGRIISTSNE